MNEPDIDSAAALREMRDRVRYLEAKVHYFRRRLEELIERSSGDSLVADFNELARAREEIERLRRESWVHQDTIQAIYRTVSWRITAPLRVVRRWMLRR